MAERQGWRFPTFARDRVKQFLVEEALMARVDIGKARAQEELAKRDAVKAAQGRADAKLAEMRRARG